MSENYRAQTPDGSAALVKKEGNYGTKLLLILLAIVLLAVVGFLAASWLPRWWAQYIGRIVGGRFTVGLMLGIGVGIVFTYFPLVIFRRVFARQGSAASRVIALVAAVVLAAPTALTLIINFSGDSSNALHAAQRTMDVDAPNFRGGTMIGAVIGVVLAIAWWYSMVQRARRRKQKYEHELEVEQLKIDKRKQAEELERRSKETTEAEQRIAAEREASAKLAERQPAEEQSAKDSSE